MRKVRFFLSATLLVIFIGCGGGSNEESQGTTAPASNQMVTPTSAPVATTSSISTPAVPLGSIFDQAILPPIEIENVRYGGTLRWPTHNSSNLDPKLNNSAIWQDVRPVYEKLVGFQAVGDADPYMQLSPELAESWSWSSDLKTYTFKLRRGVKWQNIPPVNGREFVAQDALFSFNRYREKDAVAYSFYAQVDSIEAPDKYTVVIKVKDPTAYLLNDLFANLDYVVPPELVEEGGGTITVKAVGTGPYIMKRFAIRQGSAHVRNPDYWKKDAKGNPLPYADVVEVPYVPEITTAIAAFRAGQLDLTRGTFGGPTIDDIIAISKTTPIRIYKAGVSLGGQGFTFRTNKAPWNDIRVRRAFNHALDKERFGNTIEGEGRWSHSGPLPFSLFFGRDQTLADLGPYAKFDPAEAKRLLIEAGFKDGKLKVPTPLAASQASGYGPRTATFQALYKENGIELELQAMDMATYNPLYFNRTLQDIGLTHHIVAQANLNWFAQAKFHPDASQNTAFINDSEVNRVLNEIKTTTDPAKIREYAKFLWDFDTLGSYTVWTPVGRGYAISSMRVRNFTYRVGGTGFFPLIWLTDAPRTAP